MNNRANYLISLPRVDESPRSERATRFKAFDYERIKLWNFGTFLLNFFAFYFINLLAIDQLVSLLSIRFVWLMERAQASLGSLSRRFEEALKEEKRDASSAKKARVLLSLAKFYNF